MRLAFTAAVLVLANSASAQSPHEQGRALIEKAVAAQGGLEVLSKPVAAHARIKGSFFDRMEFTGESHNGGAGKLRLVLHFKEQGSRTIIMNGDKGWSQFNGVTQEMDETTRQRTLRARYVDRVIGLVTLLRDKGYTFTPVGDIAIDEKPAMGVKISSEGQPEVTLYFDKSSGLLVKSSYRQTEVDGREALHEALFHDYEPVDYARAAEQRLRDAGRDVKTPALLGYLSANIPDTATRQEVERLITRLGAGAFAAREQASAALAKHGIKAAALLQKARKSSDIEVSRRAARCLDQLADECELAAATVRLLNVRRAVPVESLVEFLPWAPDDRVAREVEDALLASIRVQKEPAPIWTSVLEHGDARLRQLAAAALGRDGGALFKQPGHRLFLDGIRLARRSTTFVDGQERLEMETIEREYFNRLDDRLFEPDE